MINDQNGLHKEKNADEQPAYPDGLVIPDKELADLAGKLPLGDARFFATLFRVAGLALRGAVNSGQDQLDPDNLEVLAIIGASHSNETFTTLMKAVQAAVTQGRQGLLAADATLGRFRRLVFQVPDDHRFAEKLYAETLTHIRRKRGSWRSAGD